ncbi:uncharacterized protein LOC100897173 [Galendromus occidentalis]|uniref:Uncharacterized protein LOC100897173 n=1 Tax=Galendromus occidentalis TaxID=34638 RepID=A0AAJ6W040_9ACAR|nr:uncharacterized protein LOC100897173 [Galendromus occidentalis]
MEAIINEVRSSLVLLKPMSEKLPSELPAVEVDVNGTTACFEKTKKSRLMVKSNERFNDFRSEMAVEQDHAMKLCDEIRRLNSTLSKTRENDILRVGQISEENFRIDMNIDGRNVNFEIRCDMESNRYFGVKSEPPIDAVRLIDNLFDLEQITEMMSAAFRKHFKEPGT